MTQVSDFFTGLVNVLLGLLIPATGTTLSPIQVLMWAGLVFVFLPGVLAIIRSLASRGS